jgi:hypothetical protein
MTDALDAACKRLNAYKQPFAWSALQVFNSSGALALNSSSSFNSIYRRTSKELDDNSILEVLAEMKVRKSFVGCVTL